MGLFRPYERKEAGASSDQIATLTPKGQKAAEKEAAREAKASQPEVAVQTTSETTGSGKIQVTRKAGPTRSRRQAEADRMERLHPTLTPKQQRKAASKARQQQRLEAMDKVENSPERQLTRDEHFKKYIGSPVTVRLIRPRDGEREFKGTLESYDNGMITVTAPDGSGICFEKKEVRSVKLSDDE